MKWIENFKQRISYGALQITFRYWGVFGVWLVLTALAYQTSNEIFFRLVYLLLGAMVLSFLWAAHSIATFDLERIVVTPRAQVGRIAEERVMVHNTGRWNKVWLEIRDETDLPGHRVSRVLSALRARVRWSYTVRTPCRRRGRFNLGPIVVSTGDPFGFFIFRRRIANTRAALTVYPATVDLPYFAPPVGNMPGGDALRRKTHHVTTNVSGTREYAPGDSFNRIHWLSSARTERLIVKEFELDPTSDVWIFLDLERDVHVGQWWEEAVDARDLSPLWFRQDVLRLPPTTEEYCVTAAASIARYYLQRQRAVGFAAHGQAREIVPPDRGERQINRLLESLAVLRAEGRTPLTDVLSAESLRVNRGDTLVVITPSPELEWIKSARELRRRGSRVIAVLADATTFGGKVDARAALNELAASGMTTYVLREGEELREALSERRQTADNR